MEIHLNEQEEQMIEDVIRFFGDESYRLHLADMLIEKWEVARMELLHKN